MACHRPVQTGVHSIGHRGSSAGMVVRGRLRLATIVVLCGIVQSGVWPARAQSPAPSRPFHLGFTPHSPVPDEWGRFISYELLASHSDIISHTLQEGVPWIEASQSSDFCAYPSSLLRRWQDILAADLLFVPGHVRYVSIQPINSAYSGLAGFWGTDDAPLPSPWNGYDFD